jgi:hypothetical protein
MEIESANPQVYRGAVKLFCYTSHSGGFKPLAMGEKLIKFRNFINAPFGFCLLNFDLKMASSS